MAIAIAIKLILISILAFSIFYFFKALATLAESKLSVLKDILGEHQHKRRLLHTETKLLTHSYCRHICGMSFGKKTVFEQDFYQNTPIGERRVLSEQTVFAPEVNLPKIAPQVAIEVAVTMLNAKLAGLPSLSKHAIKFVRRFK